MAPPKTQQAATLVTNNNFNNNNNNNNNKQHQQQAKPRKRKNNNQNNNSNNNQQQQPIAQVPQVKMTTVVEESVSIKTAGKQEANNNNQVPAQSEIMNHQTVEVKQEAVVGQPAIVARGQATGKQQVPLIVKEALKRSPPPTAGTLVKQLSAASEIETDDIDAGIELDGSSNSGSSVKDIGETDQLKSASASPVMASAQASSGSEQAEASPQVIATKKTTTSKQQLAAHQEVIDADEQLLQQKMQKERQKKPSGADTSASIKKVATLSNGSETSKNPRAPPLVIKRRFSSQSSSESPLGSPEANQSLCKVCNQHVYQMERMLAEKSVYHKRCFRCQQCKIQLRVDSYSSHEGQVYCKTHHKQLFQPQVKLDNEDDVDIVAKSNEQIVDDYLQHRGRLSELSFSFLQPKIAEGARQRQMIICENEPKELPKDVVRSDTKVDDGFDTLNLNLGNILQRFERGQTNEHDGKSQEDASPGIVIEKPSINIKQTLKAFESRLNESSSEADSSSTIANSHKAERPVVKKLANINRMFLNKRDSEDISEAADVVANNSPTKSLPMRRSESLMLRLKKYESRVAGERVEDDDDQDDDDDDNEDAGDAKTIKETEPKLPKKINLSSLKSQWENGDINNKKSSDNDDAHADLKQGKGTNRRVSAAALEIAALRKQHMSSNGDTTNGQNDDSDDGVGNQSVLEKEEELCRIRQQLAAKKLGGKNSVRNIYENAIKEAQDQSNIKTRRDSSDLSLLNGTIKTTEIQKQLLKQVKTSYVSNNNIDLHLDGDISNNLEDAKNNNQQQTPTTPKDHFQILNNITSSKNRANKLKEKFELGLINNNSRDDSDADSDGGGEISKLEQIRQEKLEDLSVFTDGEIKAREARSLFQQIDRKISAAASVGQITKSSNKQPVAPSRSLASIGASMRTKLTNQMNQASQQQPQNHQPVQPQQQAQSQQQPIRLTNNIKT